MTRRAAAAVLAATAMLAFMTGCSKSNQGTATPTTTDKAAASAALWDPCAQISTATLQQIGVDPSSKDSGIAGVQQSGWKICSWDTPPEHNQSVVVSSTIYTVDDFKKKQDDTDFVPISIDGRDGWKYRRVSDKNNEKCDLVFSASTGGSYGVSFYNNEPGLAASPCGGAMRAANLVVPLFPR